MPGKRHAWPRTAAAGRGGQRVCARPTVCSRCCALLLFPTARPFRRHLPRSSRRPLLSSIRMATVSDGEGRRPFKGSRAQFRGSQPGTHAAPKRSRAAVAHRHADLSAFARLLGSTSREPTTDLVPEQWHPSQGGHGRLRHAAPSHGDVVTHWREHAASSQRACRPSGANGRDALAPRACRPGGRSRRRPAPLAPPCGPPPQAPSPPRSGAP